MTKKEVVERALKDGYSERTARRLAYEVVDCQIAYETAEETLFQLPEEKF